MSTVQKTSPTTVQRLGAVKTFIIRQKLSSEGKVLAAGTYKITEYIDSTKQYMNVTSVYEGQHQHNSLDIIDEKGNVILECGQVKRTCLQNVLNIYSPGGFKLGSSVKRLWKFKTEYEICSANRNLLFLLKVDSKPSGFRIEITNVDEQRVATVDLLMVKYHKIEFKLICLENIAILQKTLILCAAISCCQQEYNVLTFKYNICSKLKDKLCCPLFDENRIKFTIVCILFPLLFGLYVIGILLYVGSFPLLLALCINLLALFPKYRYFSKLVFTWPFIICGLYKTDS